MMVRPRRHRSAADDVDPLGLHVFIPGALASGFLVSIGLLIGDAVRRVRGDAGNRRRVTMTGAAAVDDVRLGFGGSNYTARGLRKRAVYGVVGIVAFSIVVGVVPGAAWNFLNPGGYLSNIAWIWAVSALLLVGVALLAVQMFRLVPEWLPIAVLVVGVGVIVRFAFGNEAASVRVGVIVVAALLTLVLVAVTSRLWRRRSIVNVPSEARPVLTRTPLGKECASDGLGRHQPAIPSPGG